MSDYPANALTLYSQLQKRAGGRKNLSRERLIC
jgi:hypothetical protein